MAPLGSIDFCKFADSAASKRYCPDSVSEHLRLASFKSLVSLTCQPAGGRQLSWWQLASQIATCAGVRGGAGRVRVRGQRVPGSGENNRAAERGGAVGTAVSPHPHPRPTLLRLHLPLLLPPCTPTGPSRLSSASRARSKGCTQSCASPPLILRRAFAGMRFLSQCARRSFVTGWLWGQVIVVPGDPLAQPVGVAADYSRMG